MVDPASKLNLGEISSMFVAFYQKTRAKVENDAIGWRFQRPGESNRRKSRVKKSLD